ncbi:MAG: type IV pilin protein [Desulfatibacillaceae bacterium]
MDSPGTRNKGFTLIELMIVIAIIGILCAIAVPNLVTYKNKGNDATANADIKNAFTAAQAYFTDFPDATLDRDKLAAAGFIGSRNVTITVNDGLQASLDITTKHTHGAHEFSVDNHGNISKSQP